MDWIRKYEVRKTSNLQSRICSMGCACLRFLLPTFYFWQILENFEQLTFSAVEYFTEAFTYISVNCFSSLGNPRLWIYISWIFFCIFLSISLFADSICLHFDKRYFGHLFKKINRCERRRRRPNVSSSYIKWAKIVRIPRDYNIFHLVLLYPKWFVGLTLNLVHDVRKVQYTLELYAPKTQTLIVTFHDLFHLVSIL